MSQFYLNGEQPALLWPSSHSFRIACGLSGLVKKALLGDANRELTDPEKIVAGISSGALSGIVSTQPPGAWRTSQLKGVVWTSGYSREVHCVHGGEACGVTRGEMNTAEGLRQAVK